MILKGSVMHYGAYAFAVDPSIPTIIVPDGVTIGQRDGFSEVIINKQCIEKFKWNHIITKFKFLA
jgi:hypothetical protein